MHDCRSHEYIDLRSTTGLLKYGFPPSHAALQVFLFFHVFKYCCPEDCVPRTSSIQKMCLIQVSIHWSRIFVSRLTDGVKLVGSTISCETAYHKGDSSQKAKHYPHVQSYIAATDQVIQCVSDALLNLHRGVLHLVAVQMVFQRRGNFRPYLPLFKQPSSGIDVLPLGCFHGRLV